MAGARCSILSFFWYPCHQIVVWPASSFRQVAKGPAPVSLLSQGIKIVECQEPKPTDNSLSVQMMEADEDFARRIQAKLDAEQHGWGHAVTVCPCHATCWAVDFSCGTISL